MFFVHFRRGILFTPNFAIAKFAPQGSCGKSKEDLPALRGNPGFFRTLFYAVAKFGVPSKADQTLVEFGHAAPRDHSGRIFR